MIPYDEDEDQDLDLSIFNDFFKSFSGWNTDLFKDINRFLEKDFAFFKGRPFTEYELKELNDYLDVEKKETKTRPNHNPLEEKENHRLQKPTRYSFLWHLNSTDPQANFVEINGRRHNIKDFFKKYQPAVKTEAKGPEVLPLIKFKPRVNIQIDEKNKTATLSIDARILAQYLRSRKLSIKSFAFNTRYVQNEDQGVLDLGFNSKTLIIRHHVVLEPSEKCFFEKKHSLKALTLKDCVIIATYEQE